MIDTAKVNAIRRDLQKLRQDKNDKEKEQMSLESLQNTVEKLQDRLEQIESSKQMRKRKPKQRKSDSTENSQIKKKRKRCILPESDEDSDLQEKREKKGPVITVSDESEEEIPHHQTPVSPNPGRTKTREGGSHQYCTKRPLDHSEKEDVLPKKKKMKKKHLNTSTWSYHSRSDKSGENPGPPVQTKRSQKSKQQSKRDPSGQANKIGQY